MFQAQCDCGVFNTGFGSFLLRDDQHEFHTLQTNHSFEDIKNFSWSAKKEEIL